MKESSRNRLLILSLYLCLPRVHKWTVTSGVETRTTAKAPRTPRPARQHVRHHETSDVVERTPGRPTCASTSEDLVSVLVSRGPRWRRRVVPTYSAFDSPVSVGPVLTVGVDRLS